MRKVILILATLFLGEAVSATTPDNISKPNFLIIVVDDLGWSDIQPFGGEINTPNINALANNGVAMTDFYVAPTCSPTRSMLLTGVDSHSAGLGTMDGLQAPNQQHAENYKGQLLDEVVTMAEALKSEGYNTYYSGKWHLATDTSQVPSARGFNRSFTLLEGGASHFDDLAPLHDNYHTTYLEDGKPSAPEPGFYSSIGYTDKILDFIGDNVDQPFFAQLAFTAPHDPLQVPDEWLDTYKGVYDQGPEVIRQQRLKRQQAAGLIPSYMQLWQPPQFPEWLPLHKPKWEMRSEKQKARDVKPMEIYAAMIEIVDLQIGRVLRHLEAQGQLDNTYVIFMSDNGASAGTPLMYPDTEREWLLTQRNNLLENQGRKGSHVFLGQEWATVAGTPWKLYKAMVSEGGIRSPLIVRGPNIPQGAITHEIGHVTDIASTVYQLIGLAPNNNSLFSGKKKPQGQSLLPLWQLQSSDSSRIIATELFGNRSVRMGNWKAHNINPPLSSGEWELYNLAMDPSEVHNLAEMYPGILSKMIAIYEQYAEDNHIIAPEPPFKRPISDLYVDECDWWCEAKLYAVDTLLELL
jgi:arylsulfatase